MSYTIAIVNQKGGVGKTTTVLNLGAALAELGKRVLLIDFDPQASLSVSLGLAEPAHSVHEALFGIEVGDPNRFLLTTEVDNLWVVPGSIDLASAEQALFSEMSRERFLLKVLRQWRDNFDYILIDNTPSLGLLTINAMAAADSLIVPVQCEYLALRALAHLTQTIEKVKQAEIQPNLYILGILPTMYNPSRKQSQEVVDRLKAQFGALVFETVIRVRSTYSYAPVTGKPVTLFDPTGEAASMYRDLAREFLTVMKRVQVPAPAAV